MGNSNEGDENNKAEISQMENTSHIAEISYDIENWLYEGMTEEKIIKMIKELKIKGEFPANLELVGVLYDEKYSIGGCAFLDTNTDKTILGFAGTNIGFDIDLDIDIADIINPIRSPLEFLEITGLKDMISNGTLLFGGMDIDSPRFKKVNEFIKNLEAKGFDIEQVTGHSLGGAIAGIVGTNHNIPYGAIYNSAAMFYLLMGNSESIKETGEGYTGNFTRFESNKDWLSFISLGGYYVGEDYIIKNGEGHGIAGFKKAEAQKLILDKLLADKLARIKIREVHFDNDGKTEVLTLEDSQLKVKNLFGQGDSYNGEGASSGKIIIDPEAFSNLQKNLMSMIDIDIAWINSAIMLCKGKNDTLKEAEERRHDELCEGIVEAFKEIGLVKLLDDIEDSHGRLESISNKNILIELSNINLSIVQSNFSGSGWHLNNSHLDTDTLFNEIRELKNISAELYSEIIATNQFETYDNVNTGTLMYRYETLSSISAAFVNLINSFSTKTKDAFKGNGFRGDKKDGIVDAIKDVLNVESENLDELEKQIKTIAEIAEGISNNFEGMDKWLSDKINTEKASGEYQFEKLPESYKAYLSEYDILSDVEEVLEAYDSQVEESTMKLTEHIAYNFEDLIMITRPKLNSILEKMYDFEVAVIKIESKLDGNVTKIEYGETTMIGYNEWDREMTTDKCGKLSTFFQSKEGSSIDISTCVASVREGIFPNIETLESASTELNNYELGLHDLKSFFNSIIEKAVYDLQELSSIIDAQKMVCGKINVMMREIENIDQAIQSEFDGKAVRTYQEQLKEMVLSLIYFSTMIDDCFVGNI